MKRFAVIVAALAFVAIGALLQAMLELEDVAQFLRRYIGWIAVLTLAGLALLGATLLLGYAILKRRARRVLGVDAALSEEAMVKGLIAQVSNPADSPEDQRNALILSLGTWFLQREAKQFYFNVFVTAVGGLVGIATLFLLYEQNKLITDQNQKITLQTDANITQSVLLEGTRRASLAGDMSNLFEAIRQAPFRVGDSEKRDCEFINSSDCWNRDDDKKPLFFVPSETLLARIRAFALRSTPYRIALSENGPLDFETPLRDQMDLQNLSPERGQLLDVLSQNKISVAFIDFSFAQLTKADLTNRYLQNARLGSANLRSASLIAADLTSADLTAADLTDARLRDAVFVDTSFFQATLSNNYFQFSSLRDANFQEANLQDTVFDRVQLEFAKFGRANLINASFAEADLKSADFRDADLTNTSFRAVNIQWANFQGANLSNASFRIWVVNEETNFDGAWAWADMTPDLPDSVAIHQCNFDPERHRRQWKPPNCGIGLAPLAHD